MSTETETPVASEAPVSDNNAVNPWASNPAPVEQQKEVEVNAEQPKETQVEASKTEEVKTEVKTEPVVQEKIVEKIVEKYPEFKDEYSKQLFEAIQNGKENELYDYLSRKNKDYGTMSDIDVVKENLKNANPSWTDKDIANEIKFKYGNIPEKKDLSLIDREENSEAYEQAERFNDDIEHKELLLSRDARDSRLALEATKKTIEFPKIAENVINQPDAPTQEQLDEAQKQWEAQVDAEMPTVSDFKFKIGDEEITYRVTKEDKAAQTDYMKSFSPEKLALERGWIKEDGNYNIAKLAEDVLKLNNLEKIIASSATQMKTAATKEVIAEIKNVDLTQKSNSPEMAQKTVGEMLWS